MNKIGTLSESELNKSEPANSDLADVVGRVFFTIRDTECNSRVFGDCEICGKPVVQVHHQIRWKETFHPILKVQSKRQISDGYGHYQCLLSVR